MNDKERPIREKGVTMCYDALAFDNLAGEPVFTYLHRALQADRRFLEISQRVVVDRVASDSDRVLYL